MSSIKAITLREAIKLMRSMSASGIPFSFSFISYSEAKQCSEGYKVVEKAILRAGYRADQSEYHNILIAYYDYTDNRDCERQFYLPLLITFNGMTITHGKL